MTAKLKQASEKILQWKQDPNQYVTEVFGVTPEPWQAEALTALAGHGRVSVRSGHGVGKSALDAWCVLWYMNTHYPCKIPCTAPTSHQLKDVLWAELAKWHRRMPEALRKEFAIKASDQDLRMYLTAAPEESFASGRTGRKDNPEALQGFHSENILFILDEASGIDDIVFQVAEGALSTPDAKVLMTANPTRTSGYFYDSHHKMRERWHTMRVSCADSTQVSPAYLEDMALKYGVDSNIYRVRVLGEFPTADDDVLIPLDLAMSAVDRDVAPIEVMPVWGLDVARFGNCRTALAKRRGNTLMRPIQSWHKRDLMEVAGLVLHEYENTPSTEMPAEILVDSVGIGAGVVDRMKELGLPVRGINVGETPSGKDRFMRLRDELWWRAREWFETRTCAIPEDDELIGQLSTLRYKISSSGKIQIERKEELLSRGVNSPDEADAFVLTMAGLDKRGVPNDRYQRANTRRRGSAWAG